MIKPVFSDMQINGHRINQFRLIHSNEMRSSRVDRLRKKFEKSQDTISEKLLLVSFLTENSEIYFTLFYLFAGLMYILISFSLISLCFLNHDLIYSVFIALAAFICHRVALKFREDFIMVNVGISLAISIYDGKINEKYNF